MQRLHHFLKTIQKLQFCSPCFYQERCHWWFTGIKNAPYLPVMLSKKIQFLKKKSNCMPKIEDCAFKKEHPIVFYWVLKMWETDFDSGILIKLVVFLIKQNSKFLQLLFYEYCTQCYFRPVLFLLCVIFAPCYFPPSSLANGLTPSWIRQDEVWFKEKYRNTRHEKSPIFIIARWQGGKRGRK